MENKTLDFDDLTDDEYASGVVKVGLCAMNKKVFCIYLFFQISIYKHTLYHPHTPYLLISSKHQLSPSSYMNII